jgi:hypothetical protein
MRPAYLDLSTEEQERMWQRRIEYLREALTALEDAETPRHRFNAADDLERLARTIMSDACYEDETIINHLEAHS